MITLQRESNKRYLETKESVYVRVPKGMRDELRAYALSHGYRSLQNYIVTLIKDDCEIDI